MAKTKKTAKTKVKSGNFQAKKVKFSRKTVIWLLIFALICTIILGINFAGTNTILNLQAESLTGSGSIITDKNAYKTKALKLTTTTPAKGSFSLPEEGAKLLVRARGAQCSGAPQMVVAIDGTDQLQASVSAQTWTIYTDSTTISKGTHSISLRFTNPYKSGSCQRALFVDVIYVEKKLVPIVIDSTPPVASIASPTNGTSVQDITAITAAASDNVAVTKVEFYISGLANGGPVGTVTASPYNYAWDTKAVANGTYTISAKAYDAAGNASALSSVSVNVKNSPSGQYIPEGDLPGWKQIFSEDFNTDAPLGSFSTVYGTRWRTYSGPDTASKSTPAKRSEYNTAKVVSVSGGILDKYLHTEYDPNGFNGAGNYMMSAALLPRGAGQIYGRYSVRLKADAVDGYKVAWLLWPDVGTNTTGSASGTGGNGEIDFAEADLINPLGAFIHWQDGTTGGSQTAFKTNPAVYLSSGWHTVTLEWGPTTNIYVDGVLEGSSSYRIPNTAMHLVLQTESELNSTPMTNSGHLQLDWAVMYSKL